MSLSATVRAAISGSQSRAIDLASGRADFAKNLAIALTNGVGANQADLVWHDRRTLAASATEDLDLSGALVDIYGQPVVFAKLKVILVAADVGNTNNVNLTRPASNGVPLFLAAGDGIAVKPGGVQLWAAPDLAGIAVTPTTGDLITLTNSAGSTGVTYDIILIGTSA